VSAAYSVLEVVNAFYIVWTDTAMRKSKPSQLGIADAGEIGGGDASERMGLAGGKLVESALVPNAPSAISWTSAWAFGEKRLEVHLYGTPINQCRAPAPT